MDKCDTAPTYGTIRRGWLATHAALDHPDHDWLVRQCRLNTKLTVREVPRSTDLNVSVQGTTKRVPRQAVRPV